MTAQLLRALIGQAEGGSGARTTSQERSPITAFANHWANLRLPPWYYKLTGGATLLAAIKTRPEDGEVPRCRPVAVGDVLRRTLERAVWKEFRAPIVKALLPQQLGVGVQSGCQKQIWIARSLHEMIVKANQHETDEDGEMEPEAVEGGGNQQDEHRDMADWIFVKLDQKNAHNCFFRAEAVKELTSMSKEFAGVFGATSAPFTDLVDTKGNRICQSIEGGQQGNPLVPASYGAALNPILKKLDQDLGESGLVRAIQDDILIVGKQDKVIELLKNFEHDLGSMGGQLAEGEGKNSIYRPLRPLDRRSWRASRRGSARPRLRGRTGLTTTASNFVGPPSETKGSSGTTSRPRSPTSSTRSRTTAGGSASRMPKYATP